MTKWICSKAKGPAFEIEMLCEIYRGGKGANEDKDKNFGYCKFHQDASYDSCYSFSVRHVCVRSVASSGVKLQQQCESEARNVCIHSLIEFAISLFFTFLTPSRWVYKPDTVKSDALVVAIHSCQSSGQKYFQNSKIPWHQGSDRKGYISVWPSSTTECWDVSSKGSLSHDGGGDSNAIANMIKYAIATYGIDPKKVYVTGGSSGGELVR